MFRFIDIEYYFVYDFDNHLYLIVLTPAFPTQRTSDLLEVACAKLFDQYSRGRLQGWIEAGRLLLNEQPQTRTRHPVVAGDRIELDAEPEREDRKSTRLNSSH